MGSIQNTSFTSQLENGLIKLEGYITLGWKGLPGKTLKLLGPIHKLQKMKCCV